MKLLRVGSLIINMDQLVAVRDEGSKLVLHFTGATSNNDGTAGVVAITLEDESCQAMRAWLTRVGTHDLGAETHGYLSPVPAPSVFGSGGKHEVQDASVLYPKRPR